MLSKLKHVKTNFCCSLGILRIVEEGSSWETFDPILAIKKWSVDTVRRTTERGSRRYKSRNFAKVNGKSLSDDDSYNEEENISENGKFVLYVEKRVLVQQGKMLFISLLKLFLFLR